MGPAEMAVIAGCIADCIHDFDAKQAGIAARVAGTDRPLPAVRVSCPGGDGGICLFRQPERPAPAGRFLPPFAGFARPPSRGKIPCAFGGSGVYYR